MRQKEWKKLQFRISTDTVKRIEAEAFKENRSVANMMEMIVRRYFDAQNEKH